MRKINFTATLSVMIWLTIMSCNNKYPFKPPFEDAAGTVIGREYCQKDTSSDYWLIAIHSLSSVSQQYGDTLTLNGVQYHNVIKVAGLPEKFKSAGEKVGFDFHISDKASITTDCSLDTPKVYKLKLAELINCGRASF